MTASRTIGVVTVARSDFGIYLPILRRLRSTPGVRLGLFVGGMHLAPEFGRSVQMIESSGFEILARVEMLVSSDSPEGLAKSTGLGVIGFAQAYAATRPDLLLVLGDRFEMHSAALAALPFGIPIAHVHGGEVTLGAIDDALRHGITKLSHLHFVATEEYARRVRQLGEEPWRVVVSGAPSLENLSLVPKLSRLELEASLGFALEDPALLVTYHPVTREADWGRQEFADLLAALDRLDVQTIFTLPNADTGGRQISQRVREFLADRPRAHLVENLGTERYFNLLRHVTAMVGNSSSGIIEAPSFHLPVVNVGIRQAGRVRATNVRDVSGGPDDLRQALLWALSPATRSALAGCENPYLAGAEPSRVIAERLSTVALGKDLLLKRFLDLPATAMP